MMAEWWRSWHGAPTDPKWRVVAKRAKVPTSTVVAVAWAIFDRASQATDRGSIEGLDAEVLSDFLDLEIEEVERVVGAMTLKGILADGRILSWEKRQPKRERDDDNSAERTRKYRENQKKSGVGVTTGDDDVPPCDASVTPCDATTRPVTPRTEERREEQRREEKKEPLAAAADPVTARKAEKEAAAAASQEVDDPFAHLHATYHDRVLKAVGIEVNAEATAKWFSSTEQWYASRWMDELGLTEPEVLTVIADVRARPNGRPPGSLKYFNLAMQDAAGRKIADPLKPIVPDAKPPPNGDERARQRARWDRIAAENQPKQEETEQ